MDKIAEAGLYLRLGDAMSEVNEGEYHFYCTLAYFNLRVGISPVSTLVLPMIKKKEQANACSLVSHLADYHSVQSPCGWTQTESAASAVKK